MEYIGLIGSGVGVVAAVLTVIIAAWTLFFTIVGVYVVRSIHEEQRRIDNADRLRNDIVLALRIRAGLRKHVGRNGDEATVSEDFAEEMRGDAYRLETKDAAGIKKHLLEYFGAARIPPKRNVKERQALKDAVEKFVADHAG